MSLFKKFCDRITKSNANAVIMMSGGGSNARKILENKTLYSNINFVAIVTDQDKSNAKFIAKEYGLKYICVEGKFKNKEEREMYFDKLASLLEELAIEVLIYAGYMKIVTDKFLNQFPGINSHPADLRVKNSSTRPKYVGMNAVKMSLDDGQRVLRCSCCLVENPVDSGRLIAVSNPVRVSQNTTPEEAHQLLKENAEWYYYPQVLKKLAYGELNSQSEVFVFES